MGCLHESAGFVVSKEEARGRIPGTDGSLRSRVGDDNDDDERPGIGDWVGEVWFIGVRWMGYISCNTLQNLGPDQEIEIDG